MIRNKLATDIIVCFAVSTSMASKMAGVRERTTCINLILAKQTNLKKKNTFDFPSQHTNKITEGPVRQEAFSFIKHGDRYGYA